MSSVFQYFQISPVIIVIMSRGNNGSERKKGLPCAVDEAEAYIGTDPDALSRLEEVFGLIDGYETPYGMELLTSVRWINRREGIVDSQDVMARIQNWSSKGLVFKPAHIEVVLTHQRQ